MAQSSSYYGHLLTRYWNAAESFQDFVKLLRIRLARSSIGWLVCPRPVSYGVRLGPYGGRVVLRSHTTDISVNDELIVSAGYESLRRHVTGKVDTIVDLGANNGLAACWMLSLFPGAKVLSVEPHPGNLAILQQNAAGRAIQIEPVAAGATDREVLLFTRSGEHGFTMVGTPAATQARVTVKVERFADILQRAGMTHVDILKVDIEGAEKELFESCKEWIAMVDWLVIECHHGFGINDLIAILARQGAHFDVVEQQPKSGWGHETGLLRRRG